MTSTSIQHWPDTVTSNTEVYRDKLLKMLKGPGFHWGECKGAGWVAFAERQINDFGMTIPEHQRFRAKSASAHRRTNGFGQNERVRIVESTVSGNISVCASSNHRFRAKSASTHRKISGFGQIPRRRIVKPTASGKMSVGALQNQRLRAESAHAHREINGFGQNQRLCMMKSAVADTISVCAS